MITSIGSSSNTAVNNGTTIKSMIVLIVVLSAKILTASPIAEKAKESLNYLVDNVAFVRNTSQIDIQKTQNAIDNVTTLLEKIEVSRESEIFVRSIRARSIFALNLALKDAGSPTDNSLSFSAVEDIEYISRNDRVLGNELFFIAGILAHNFLKDSVLASSYWEKCANSGHAGCMNNKAHYHFSGSGGFPIDTLESVRWHKKVYNTNLMYGCAGIYSANAISLISYYFPSSLRNESWQDWRQKRNELINKIKINNPNIDCAFNTMSFDDYLIGLKENKNNFGDLKKIIDAAELDSVKEILNLLNDDLDESRIIQKLDNINANASACEFSFNIVLYARNSGQRKAFKGLSEYFETLDRENCATEFAFIKRFREQNKWD